MSDDEERKDVSKTVLDTMDKNGSLKNEEKLSDTDDKPSKSNSRDVKKKEKKIWWHDARN